MLVFSEDECVQNAQFWQISFLTSSLERCQRVTGALPVMLDKTMCYYRVLSMPVSHSPLCVLERGNSRPGGFSQEIPVMLGQS